MNEIKRHSYDELMYLAMGLITFTTFPLQKYGLGSSKNLAIFPIILYVIINIFSRTTRIDKSFRNELLIIFALLISSLLQGMFIYNDLRGFGFACNMWLSYCFTFISLYFFIQDADNKKITKFLKSIFLSFKIAFIFGLIELVYFYILKINFLSSFVQLFVRDSMYLNNGRVQFNFGEPSESLQIIGLLFPVIYILSKKNYTFQLFDKITIIGLIILSIFFTKSVSFIAGIGIFSLVLIFNKIKKKKIVIGILITIAILLSTIIIVQLNNIYEYANENNIRALKLITNPEDSLSEDFSSATRIGLWVLAIKIFIDSPIIGCGNGYFGYNFAQYLDTLDPIFITQEMINKCSDIQQQTYSIISTMLCEGGFIGILWLILFFRRIDFKNKYNQLFAPILLVILIQNMYIYMPLICVIYFMLTNPKIQSYIKSSHQL